MMGTLANPVMRTTTLLRSEIPVNALWVFISKIENVIPAQSSRIAWSVHLRPNALVVSPPSRKMPESAHAKKGFSSTIPNAVSAQRAASSVLALITAPNAMIVTHWMTMCARKTGWTP